MGKSAAYIMLPSGQDTDIALTSSQQLWLSANPYSSLDGGEAHKAAPTAEELLATDGCSVCVSTGRLPILQ